MCGICLEELTAGSEIGELDSCNHRQGGSALACELLLDMCALVGSRAPTPVPLALPGRLCYPCVSRWAEIESRCPFCKLRFTWLRRKQLAGREELAGADPNAPLPGRYLDSKQVEERNQVRGEMGIRGCREGLEMEGGRKWH